MKTVITILAVFLLVSCGNSEELSNLKKENAALAAQVKALDLLRCKISIF